MPSVKQLDWDKLTPKQPQTKTIVCALEGTKDFPDVQYARDTKNAHTGYIRVKKRSAKINP